MSAEQRELFRLAVLNVMSANDTRFGLTAGAVKHMTVLFGFPEPGIDEVNQAIRYLESGGLLEPIVKTISPENRPWRITKAGIDFLAVRKQDAE